MSPKQAKEAPGTPARLLLKDGRVYAPDFGDCYFAAEGLEESRHNFIEANRLTERFSSMSPGENFIIAETGFGTGLNFLASMYTWSQVERATATRLTYISFEAYPIEPEALKSALSIFSNDLSNELDTFLEQYQFPTPGTHRILFEEQNIELILCIGELNASLDRLWPKDQPLVDAWFLDGFAPDLNPEMWTLKLFLSMARHARPDTSASSFSVSGTVKNGLRQAGFKVKKRPGFGRKREMLTAQKDPELWLASQAPWFHWPKRQASKRATIIGAGVAGCNTAYALCKKGWQVELYDPLSPGQGASGCAASVFYPSVGKTQDLTTSFHLDAFTALTKQLAALHSHTGFKPRGKGVLLTATSDERRQQLLSYLKDFELADEFATYLSAGEALRLIGYEGEGLHFKEAGYMDGASYCSTLLQAAQLEAQKHDSSFKFIQEAYNLNTPLEDSIVIDCRGYESITDSAQLPWAVVPVRGQASYLSADRNTALSQIKAVVCAETYLTPVISQTNGINMPFQVLGSSYIRDNIELSISSAEHQENLRQAPGVVRDSIAVEDVIDGFAGIRLTTDDRLPVVGPFASLKSLEQSYSELYKAGPNQLLDVVAYEQGHYVNTGYGSRGFTHAAYVAELLAEQLDSGSRMADEVLARLHPSRFIIRHLSKSPEHRRKRRWECHTLPTG